MTKALGADHQLNRHTVSPPADGRPCGARGGLRGPRHGASAAGAAGGQGGHGQGEGLLLVRVLLPPRPVTCCAGLASCCAVYVGSVHGQCFVGHSASYLRSAGRQGRCARGCAVPASCQDTVAQHAVALARLACADSDARCCHAHSVSVVGWLHHPQGRDEADTLQSLPRCTLLQLLPGGHDPGAAQRDQHLC